MQTHPIDVTKEVFMHFGNGDIPAIVSLLADDVVIDFYGPDVIPYAGHYEGNQHAAEFFKTVLSSVEIHQFEPEEFLSDGNKVTVTGHLRLTALSTGKQIESDFVHVITVVDGKWSRFRDFMDTSQAVAAFSNG
tara:strand:+ start:12843 stop:13244 length:402 start_codon:yes stop_codon:yes gene_type:complete